VFLLFLVSIIFLFLLFCNSFEPSSNKFKESLASLSSLFSEASLKLLNSFSSSSNVRLSIPLFLIFDESEFSSDKFSAITF